MRSDSFNRRLTALEARTNLLPSSDWQERLTRYKRWFQDGEKWEGPQTEKEKADLARYQAYFDSLETSP